MNTMWNVMVLLYPELWEKFGKKSPTISQIKKYGGYPKDKTSKLYVEFIKLYDICHKMEGDINSDENLSNFKKLGDCRVEFFDSIKDERIRYILKLTF